MEIDTDNIVAFMSFLVGSYLFISRNSNAKDLTSYEMTTKLKRDKQAVIDRENAENKVNKILNNLLGIKKDIDKDKEAIKKLQDDKSKLDQQRIKELEKIEKNKEKQKIEKEKLEDKKRQEFDEEKKYEEKKDE